MLDRRLVDEIVFDADRVFHLAAAVGVRRIIEQPLESLRVNLHGTENVLEAALARAVMVLASTSEIYGKNTADALREDADRILGSPLSSRWTYAAAKGIDEAFAHAYWREFGLQVSIVRLFNTVGPRQTGRYGMVVPNLVGQALRGEPLTVFGDGAQTRCFSYVGDIVPALVALAEDTGSLRSGVQSRWGARDLDLRPGRAHRRAHRQQQRHRAGALRPGLRRGLRGHAPSGAGQLPGRAGAGFPARHQSGRDHPRGRYGTEGRRRCSGLARS